MLNFIYYPVSFIMWCWHEVFGSLFGAANSLGWALSIVFLVFTLRAVLLKPAISQVRSMRRVQQFAPQLSAIQKKYANDRQRQATELQKLQSEHGIHLLGGCLPTLMLVPVFIGLNHVLRTFTQYQDRANYFFPGSDVRSYLAAKPFGDHLGDAIFNTSLVTGHGMHHALWMWQVAPVAIPLIIIAAIATHFTARLSAKRQPAANAAGPALLPSRQIKAKAGIHEPPVVARVIPSSSDSHHQRRSVLIARRRSVPAARTRGSPAPGTVRPPDRCPLGSPAPISRSRCSPPSRSARS